MFACVARSFSQVVLGFPLGLVPCRRPVYLGGRNLPLDDVSDASGQSIRRETREAQLCSSKFKEC